MTYQYIPAKIEKAFSISLMCDVEEFSVENVKVIYKDDICGIVILVFRDFGVVILVINFKLIN